MPQTPKRSKYDEELAKQLRRFFVDCEQDIAIRDFFSPDEKVGYLLCLTNLHWPRNPVGGLWEDREKVEILRHLVGDYYPYKRQGLPQTNGDASCPDELVTQLKEFFIGAEQDIAVRNFLSPGEKVGYLVCLSNLHWAPNPLREEWDDQDKVEILRQLVGTHYPSKRRH